MFFSIVIPVHNRETHIRRAVASALAQTFGDYELILVDDCSTDSSLAVMRSLAAPNVQVLARDKRGGVGGARNTGIAAARGDWVVLLDSDDELVPGALDIMFERAAASPDAVAGLWFRCRMDDGQLIPTQLTEPQEWDYAGFLAFWNATARQWRDMIYCIHRSSFAVLPQPEGRMDDIKYLIDFASQFRIRAYPDVLRLYHQDAENQLVRITRRLDPRHHQAIIIDRANEYRQLIADHRAALAEKAPALYGEYLESAATTATMAHRRWEAVGYALTALCLVPLRLRNWVILGAALVGPFAAVVRRWTSRD